MSESHPDPRVPAPEVHDDPAVVTTIVIGVISLVLVVVLVLGLEVLYGWTVEREDERKVTERAPSELSAMHAEQEQRLAGYRWVDRERGIVSIPIERAIDEVVAEYGAGEAR